MDDEPFPETSSMDDALVWYEAQPWLRAVIQAVPFIDGSVDTILAWRAVHLNRQRVQELFKNVSTRLSHVEESAINTRFLQSESFFDLLRACAETVSRTSSEQKRKYVADFLAGTIKKGNVHDLSQQIVEDLKLLQDVHLQILSILPESSSAQIDLHSLREMSGFSD